MHRLDLSESLLARVLERLEDDATRNGYCNYFLAMYAAEAAVLLDFPGLLQRYKQLLPKKPPANFLRRLLSWRRSAPSSILDGLRDVRTTPQIVESLPVFTESYCTDIVADRFPELPSSVANGNDLDAFYAQATTQLDLEDLARSLILLGQRSDDTRITDGLVDEGRKINLDLTSAIEAFRHGNPAAGYEFLDRTPSVCLTDWAGAHVAVGVAGHVPWDGYPYADY